MDISNCICGDDTCVTTQSSCRVRTCPTSGPIYMCPDDQCTESMDDYRISNGCLALAPTKRSERNDTLAPECVDDWPVITPCSTGGTLPPDPALLRRAPLFCCPNGLFTTRFQDCPIPIDHFTDPAVLPEPTRPFLREQSGGMCACEPVWQQCNSMSINGYCGLPDVYPRVRRVVRKSSRFYTMKHPRVNDTGCLIRGSREDLRFGVRMVTVLRT
eukprot:974969_1